MGFVGQLSDFRMVDLVQTIAAAGKTGRLNLDREHGKGAIVFREGKIVYATSSSMPRETLGSLLVGEGLLTPEELKAAIAAWSPRRNERRLGEVLTTLGLVSEEDLERVLSEQIERNVSECLEWTHGAFEFELMNLPAGDGVELDAKELVLDEGVVAEHILLSIAVQLDHLEKPPAAGPATGAVEAGPGGELAGEPLDDQRVFQSHVSDMGSPELTAEVTIELLRRARELFARGVLFIVRSRRYDAVGGFGVGSAASGKPVSIREISVGAGKPSILRQVVETGEKYYGPMPFLPANRQLLEQLGRAAPTAVAALPVIVNGSVPLVFYGDHPRDDPEATLLEGVERALARIGREMGRQLDAPEEPADGI